MIRHSALHRFVAVVLLLALVLPTAQAAPARRNQDAGIPGLAAVEFDDSLNSGLFRTTITVPNDADWAHLERLGIVILGRQNNSATVLADDEQLETLARLRFEPQASDELGGLLRAQGPDKAWLQVSLQPLVDQGVTLQALPADKATAGEAVQSARSTLRSSMSALTAEQHAGVASSSSIDDDADGLTNTQEQWWCTNTLNPDSDGDGATDGTEVQAAKDWLSNRAPSYPSTGKPFAQWPPQIPGCVDDDQDSVPDMAERWDLGLNMNRESTDRDKFDDGQELFGLTYCPGSGGYCGYGALSRNEDWGVIFAEMPSWVKRPGNHPLVAAYPVPEVNIVESSIRVETVTTITTDHVIASGTERSYSTSKLEGTAKSEGQTETWNDWEEISRTSPLSSGDVTEGPTPPGWAQENCPGLGPMYYLDKICFVGSTAFNTGYDLCSNEQGSLSLDQCKRGAQRKIDAARSFGSKVLDGIKDVGSRIVDVTGLAIDMIQNTFDLNSCSLGIPSGISCEFVVQDGRLDPTAGKIGRQSYSGATSDVVGGLGNHEYYLDGNSARVATNYPAIYATLQLPPTETQSQGRSWGGSHTTTHTTYEEHTITNGEAYSSEESWANGTVVDSGHAADLWFTYQIRNSGTEYAREIGDLAFNVYIGDDPNPVYTYFVAPDLGGDGKFHNFMPGEEHTYSARTNTHAIPLTFDMLKAIEADPACAILRAMGEVAPYVQGGRCPGSKLRIVVEDFTYGIDELFYEDAANAGVLVAVEDGTDDSDEAIDTYLIPTWGAETVLDVLTRYFPRTTDADGKLIAIWTPEYRSDTPSWCVEPQVVGTGSQRTLWCKHALSTADWWNIYTNGLGDGSEGFQDTPASPGSVALFRFNKDSDLDGYSDRSEERLGTDPDDAADYPRPELLAGVHSTRTGNHVVATLSLINTGLYDAYGVEAVMIAPNDTITVTNNTVGGSGRVRAQKQVIVGSRILPQSPLPQAWQGSGHAKPATGGYYTSTADRSYTFTVQCSNPGGCSVSSGAWSLAWNDGGGASGSLNFGAGYASPTLLDVGTFGVKLGLLTGTVANGESFTVQANTPRDTFQYDILQEPYTPPLVLVSYNDPQGNHRFAIPPAAMALASPTADLMAFSGDMLPDPGVEIVTSAAFAPGATTTNLVVNNPTETTLTDAHLFLEFIDPAGTVVSEVPTTIAQLPPGPTVQPVTWYSASFDPAFDPAQDYIVMAFWTDYQGNILDTAARPLSSFQDDPRPAFAMDADDELWDFGTAQQGTLMQRKLRIASAGFGNLLARINVPSSLTVTGPQSTALPPGDVGVYTVSMNTQFQPVGHFEQQIQVRTNAPENPIRTITILGEITPMPEDAPGGAIIRPLDWTANIPGSHSQGEWVEFTHTLGPNLQTLHPVKVYSQDYATLWGVGKYATDFGQGTASADMFGDGIHGDILINTTQTFATPMTRFASTATAGQNVVYFESTTAFDPGNEILLIQMQGAGAGAYEFARIASHSGQQYVLQDPLTYTYTQDTTSKAQAIFVHHFHNVTVTSGVEWVAPAWNGSEGGLIVFRVSDTLTLGGTINVSGAGFKGGLGSNSGGNGSWQGDSYTGAGSQNRNQANGGGGGGGLDTSAGSGAGGGYGTPGNNGGGQYTAYGGTPYGAEPLAHLFLGSGGGGSNSNDGAAIPPGNGGAGAGIVFISAKQSQVDGGSILANGADGTWQLGGLGGSHERPRSGGGGSGGSILIRARDVTLGTALVNAVGGDGPHSQAGDGGIGRIRVEYCETVSGSTNPPANNQILNCYIVEQIESAPYDHSRLNAPESFSDGRIYQVQYGRRFVFTTAGNQTQSIRMPKQLYATATLDALVSNTGASSGGLNLCLDVGNNGSCDFTHNATTNFPAMITATGLAPAINDYMVAQTGIPWGADIDVPVRVQIDRQADVLLTNLVLNLQSNQPSALLVTSVDTGADLPLDWTEHIGGSHNQGETYDYEHTIGPGPVSIHPCKVYDQAGTVLKGAGMYCTDFSGGMASYGMFGDGRDGVMPSSGNLDNTNGAGVGTANGTAGSTSISVADKYGVGRINPGDVALIHQSRGLGAGKWELNKAASDFAGSGTFILATPLANSYVTNAGAERAQILRVPQYTDCPAIGTLTPLMAWNGEVGGIFAIMCSGTANVSGVIDASGRGFVGGTSSYGHAPGNGEHGKQGEGTSGPGGGPTKSANGNGGGGGVGNEGGDGGGGGGNGSNGIGGNTRHNIGDGGQGGGTSGDETLVSMVFGGGGGSGGGEGNSNSSSVSGAGGQGGGIVVLLANAVQVTGSVIAGGSSGGNGTRMEEGSGGGGGGAGGSVLVRARQADLGSGKIKASAGGGGAKGGGASGDGGAGGVGRIRVEYCDTVSGSITDPLSTPVRLICYSTEQVDQSPYMTTRLYLPDSFTDGQTYLVQYGRRFVFTGSGQQTSYLRVGRRMVGTASLDVLVSNTGVASGNLDLCVDIGNDGSCDFTHNAATGFPATLAVSSLEDAFNNYLIAQANIPWGDPIDVPVRVQVDRQADVMLTNLALTPVGAKTRFLRLPAQNYANVVFSVRYGDETTPAGALAYAVDVGADDVVDWSGSGSHTYPATVTSPNMAAAFNSYLAGRTGEVDVPIRITPSPSLDTALHTFQATPTAQPDLTLTEADFTFGSANPVEGDVVAVNITVHNTGSLASGPLVASVYATAAEWGEWYIGSAFVANVPAAGTATVPPLPWNTLGFTSDVPVRVVLDPFDRVDETSETNNEATKSLTIKTRPDLKITVIDLSDDEPVAGETITVGMTVANTGQTAAGASVLALYDGNPDDGGILICEQPLAAPSQSCPWTPAGPGLYRLFAVADRDRTVGESNEGNNTTRVDVYVGVAGPLLLDSGGPADPPYTPQLGYGYLSGQASTFCGTQPEQSQRTMGGEPVVYRFDHLLPGHFYHLDVTLFECDGLGRLQQIHVDDNLISENVSLADGQVHRLSYLLDPALYVDHGIVVKIGELTGNDAVVAQINLHDIYYRYADAGGGNDPQYSVSTGYGWLDGMARQPWGTLPYQTRRIDEADSNPADDPDNELRYQFDGLDPALRYQLHVTFYQAAGSQADQDVRIDGAATGTSVQVGADQRVDVTVDVPVSTYASDRSIVAQIVRSTAANAFANEIALEQRTVVEGAPPVPDIDVVPVTLSASQPPNNTTNQQFTISNLGDGGLGWSIAESTGSCGTPGDIGWASVNPASGSTAASGSSNVTVTFNSTGLAPGSFAAVLCVNSDDPDEPTVTIDLTLTVENTGNQPLLDIPDNIPGYPNQTVAVPIPFASNGASIASLVYSIDFDQGCLAFDPTDGDGDGTPDAVTFSLPPAFQGSVTFDASDTDGELDFFIADTFPPLSALPSGTPATIEFMVICQPSPGTSVSAPVLFSSNPAASFGSTGGGSVPGVVLGGSVEIQSVVPGNCNADNVVPPVNAGDISAVVLEIFDGDGDDPMAAPGGTFPGSPVGCDANQDATIDAGDISCVVLIIFNGPNACGGSLNLETPGIPSEAPALSLLEPKLNGDRMIVPIGFSPGNSEISSLVFAVDYDPAAAGIDPTDADGNGIPDAIALNLPPEFQAAVIVNAAAGRLQVMIADIATPLAALPKQVIAQVTWQVKAGAVETANLRFAEGIRASFGDMNGRSVPGS